MIKSLLTTVIASVLSFSAFAMDEEKMMDSKMMIEKDGQMMNDKKMMKKEKMMDKKMMKKDMHHVKAEDPTIISAQ